MALGTGTRVGYGSGSVATGAFGTVPGLLLLPFLTDALGVATLAAGAIVVLPKAWDVLLNPVAGRVSDRSRDPRGPRRPFLLRGGIALAVCFALLFAVPDAGPTWAQAGVVLLVFFGCATAYAFFQVPYLAMPAEVTSDYDERTRLMTWRVAILLVAIMVSGASAPAIQGAFGGREGYRVMGVVMAVLILVGVIGAYAGTRRAPVRRIASSPGTLRAQLRVVATARDFRLLLVTFVIQALAVACMLAGVDYVADEVFGVSGAGTLLFVCFLAPGLVFTPLWTQWGTRRNKRAGYLTASGFLVAGGVLAATTLTTPDWLIFVATGLVGVGYSGCQMFPLAMLPDAASVDAWRTGENRVGVYSGVWTAGETLGLALGPGVYAIVLWLGNYQSSSAAVEVTQPDSAITAIVLGFSLLPAVLVVLSLFWLWRYRLDAATVAAARAALPDEDEAAAAPPPDAGPAERTDQGERGEESP